MPATDITDMHYLEDSAEKEGRRAVRLISTSCSAWEVESSAILASRYGRAVLRRRRWLGLDRQSSAQQKTFTDAQITIALHQFLDYGEQSFCGNEHTNPGGLGACRQQHGYFSGNGWAARALRYHLSRLNKAVDKQTLTKTPVFRVIASDCEAEVELLKGALEMSNRYPEPRIG